MEPIVTAEVVQPPRRGWWSRNWLWAAPAGCLLIFVLPLGCCIGIFGGTMLALKNSEPYQIALKKVQTDPKVIAQLGEPIKEARWFPSGSINVENGSGSAILNFDVAGPKGQAHVMTQARRIGGKWGLTSLDVTLPDGKRIPIKAEAGGDEEEAPRWTPSANSASTSEKPQAAPAPDIDLKLPAAEPPKPR